MFHFFIITPNSKAGPNYFLNFAKVSKKNAVARNFRNTLEKINNFIGESLDPDYIMKMQWDRDLTLQPNLSEEVVFNAYC
jgi:hypothetical protein